MSYLLKGEGDANPLMRLFLTKGSIQANFTSWKLLTVDIYMVEKGHLNILSWGIPVQNR